MKPHRLRMTHSLLLAYGMYKKMEVYRPHPASAQEMERFHAGDYVDFLQRVTAENSKEFLHQLPEMSQQQKYRHNNIAQRNRHRQRDRQTKHQSRGIAFHGISRL